MPKNKTHSGAKKRFRVTGSGKIMREQANKRHLRAQVFNSHPSSVIRPGRERRRRQEDQEASR